MGVNFAALHAHASLHLRVAAHTVFTRPQHQSTSCRTACKNTPLVGICISMSPRDILQTEQLRKSACVPEDGVDYHPDRHRSCTIYAGTMVQQVRQQPTFLIVSRLQVSASAFLCCVLCTTTLGLHCSFNTHNCIPGSICLQHSSVIHTKSVIQ